jgi:hypothetical protein
VKEEFSRTFKFFPKIKHVIEHVIRGDYALKRGLKRNLVKSFKTCISRLMIIQKILLVTVALLRRSSSKLKPKLSVVLRYIPKLTTRMVTMLTHALQFIAVQATKKRKQTITVLLVLVLLVFNVFFLSTTTGQLFVKTNLYSYGSIQIQTIGVTAYQDANCTTPVSDVAWGTLAPGLSKTNIIYVKNEGTTFLTLSLDTTDWNPTNAPDYMSLNWDYDGTTVAPNQVI